MHICYQLPSRMSVSRLGAEEIERRSAFLAAHAFPGTAVTVQESDGGPESIESELASSLAVPWILHALEATAKDRVDAFIIGCFGDPGLSAARELVSVPVIGPAQASIHQALQLGHKFGILTVTQSVVPVLRRLVLHYGFGHDLAGVYSVDVPVLELRSRRDLLETALLQRGRQALETGADVLVIGCMTMGFLEVGRTLSDQLSVPVVNPVTAALKAAETAAALSLCSSRRAYPIGKIAGHSPSANPAL